MRVIQTYIFRMSAKTPYSDYPSIARRFLEEQNLVAGRFLYYFDELIVSKSYEEAISKGSCAKAVKDCPALGDIHFLNGIDYKLGQSLFLSNIHDSTDCSEADILPHMQKIHRRYGFCESDLYYYDVNFFQDIIPYERDLSRAKNRAAYFQLDLEPALFLCEQPYGSGIRLHRSIAGGNYISLSVDLLHNGKIHNATPYFKAMQALLPRIRPDIRMKIYLADAEKQEIAYWDKEIAPALEKARTFFNERYPTTKKQNHSPSTYTLAPQLKKLAKQHGFSCRFEGLGIYTLDKRTVRGHVLRLAVDSGPSHYDTTYRLTIQGIGFSHSLCMSMQCPSNQAESDACSEKMFSNISEFEQTLLPELDIFYEETPNWFIPTNLW